LNQVFEVDASDNELMELGVKIGADVPYCIIGGTAMCEGIGEIITPLKPFKNHILVLVKPNFGLSTKEVFKNLDINKIFKPDNFEFNIIENILSERLNDIKKLPFYSQVSVGELLSYTLNTLLKDTDQMSMASALEIREPFFDYKLVEYVMQVPDKYKFRKYKKSLLVESLSTLLPSEIVHRPKMGFVFPWDVWMKNELKDFCEDKIYRLAKSSIFESSQIIKIWEDFLAGNKRVLWSYVWQLVVLENWLLENDIQD